MKKEAVQRAAEAGHFDQTRLDSGQRAQEKLENEQTVCSAGG